MDRDQLIDIAKKIDDLTLDLSNEDFNSALRIAQGLHQHQIGVHQTQKPPATENKV